jgi:hypothetical protein
VQVKFAEQHATQSQRVLDAYFYSFINKALDGGGSFAKRNRCKLFFVVREYKYSDTERVFIVK